VQLVGAPTPAAAVRPPEARGEGGARVAPQVARASPKTLREAHQGNDSNVSELMSCYFLLLRAVEKSNQQPNATSTIKASKIFIYIMNEHF
jgi:hypothetical protein